MPNADRDRKPLILIIDDDETFRSIMREILERAGYEILTSASVADAYQVMLELQPDLILTDIMMPEIDGLTLVRFLRSHPTWSGIPLIVVSARVMESDRDAARRAGADAFLEKPFTMQHLTRTISTFLAAV